MGQKVFAQIGTYRLREITTKSFAVPVPILEELAPKVAERFRESVASLLVDCYREFENFGKREIDVNEKAKTTSDKNGN